MELYNNDLYKKTRYSFNLFFKFQKNKVILQLQKCIALKIDFTTSHLNAFRV